MSRTTALLTANIPLIPSGYNRDILAIYATNNRVLKEHLACSEKASCVQLHFKTSWSHTKMTGSSLAGETRDF